ncbi:MAG: hypothetical protein U5L04_04230 [Trueperaceae bacterium]|nr:hypothetical protein [Trueperaceae bacterium]
MTVRTLCLLLLLLVGACAPRTQTAPGPQRYVATVSGALEQIVAVVTSLDPSGLGPYRVTDVDPDRGVVRASYRRGDDIYYLRATVRSVGAQRVLVSVRSEITGPDREPFVAPLPDDDDPATVDLFPARTPQDAEAVRYLYDQLAARLLVSP